MSFYGEGVKLEIHIIKPWCIDRQFYLIIIGVMVSRRNVRSGFSVLILIFLFLTLFFDFQPAGCHSRQWHDIRIFFFIQPACHGKQSLGLIKEHMISVSGKFACSMEVSNRIFILFSVVQLSFDLFYGTVASLLKPWRKLCCTVFTKITVVQLPVSQKTYFITADITILFVK